MNDGNYVPKDEYERACRERYDFAQSLMGKAMNITKEELEGKNAFEKAKYIFKHGYANFSHVTLIKAVCILAQEVDALHEEIRELKEQLNKE